MRRQAYELAQRSCDRMSVAQASWMAQRLADAYQLMPSTERRTVATGWTASARWASSDGRRAVPHARQVREVFRHFAQYLVEFLQAHRLEEAGIAVEGQDEVVERLRPLGGAILLSAHLGNWELGAIVLQRRGLAVSEVALPHADPEVDRFFNAQRARCGVEVIPLRDNVVELSLRRLGQCRLLGMIGDRDFTGQGEVVEFCGRPVSLPRGPAVLSARARVPVVPLFLVREGCGRLRFHMEAPIDPEQPRGPEWIRRQTQRYARVMEGYIRRYPTQWILW